jgi:antitoxin component of RelBE/YafQ-DinJ toxin-antitoxin module
VLVNPLAHALVQALETARAAGAGEWETLEIERYRTRPIEADDTAFARLTFTSGVRLLAAVTLAGEDFIAGDIVVDGSGGRAVLEYPTDRLALPGAPPSESGRTGLLQNLIAHRRTGEPLIAPLDRTAIFTTVLEAITAPDLPPPTLLAAPHVESRAGVRVITGINALLRQVADTGSLPSELAIPWATPPAAERAVTASDQESPRRSHQAPGDPGGGRPELPDSSVTASSSPATAGWQRPPPRRSSDG